MALDKSAILIGAPDQSTTGAVYTADPSASGYTAPTDAVTALSSAFSASGYVSEAGLTVGGSFNTTDINDWSGDTVRRLVTKYDGKVSLAFIQLDEATAKQVFGADNVTVTAATSTHGKQLSISMGKAMAPRCAWAFNMKDGDNKLRVFMPDAQVTSLGDITFSAGAAIELAVEITTYPDTNGKHIYLFTDDGQVTA